MAGNVRVTRAENIPGYKTLPPHLVFPPRQRCGAEGGKRLDGDFSYLKDSRPGGQGHVIKRCIASVSFSRQGSAIHGRVTLFMNFDARFCCFHEGNEAKHCVGSDGALASNPQYYLLLIYYFTYLLNYSYVEGR